MSLIPKAILKVRYRIVKKYIHGRGVEVGALHHPTAVPWGVQVTYVDRLSEHDLRLQYPELNKFKLAPIGIVDNGEVLESIPNSSLDFIIANHMLEHCENPIGTLRNHLGKLKHGGILYYAVPDKRNSFDTNRPVTPFTHLIHDDADGGESSRFHHHLEWSKMVNQISNEEEAIANSHRNIAKEYSIHFHVWDSRSWLEFLNNARDHIAIAFEVLHFEYNDVEIISVIRRV